MANDHKNDRSDMTAERKLHGLLALLFAAILLVMLGFTVRATRTRGVFDNGHLLPDVWFQATLVDAYLGFLTFFVWVAWKERHLGRQLTWFVLIMTLGNMAMSAYVLWKLYRLPRGAGIAELLTERSD